MTYKTNLFIEELRMQHSEYVKNRNTWSKKVREANSDFMKKQNRLAALKRQENTKEDEEHDLYNPHYVDAPEYAKKYYGDVYHFTVKYDNEWD